MTGKKRIAVIGAGPAGYTAAKELLQNGFAVDIYEKEAELGGAVYTGIPVFRMPKQFLQKEHQALQELGCGFRFGCRVDRKEFARLRQSYDGILAAIGAQVENTFGFAAGTWPWTVPAA